MTYKTVEPSAGEFPENARRYYTASKMVWQVAEDAVLVIGSGFFRGKGMRHLVVMRRQLRYQKVAPIAVSNHYYEQ